MMKLVCAIGQGQVNGTGLNEKVGALNCMDDHEKLFIASVSDADVGGGKGLLIQENKTGTIATSQDQTVFAEGEEEFILRRITPTECARLQGMPDWWCDDIPHSDSAEYRMWGNGIALPCAIYIMEGLKQFEQEVKNDRK